MNDYQSFLRHLLESPGDEVARLVFADWLEEQGQAIRAEFVRLSVQLMNVTSESEYQPLLSHHSRLLADHWNEVSGGLPDSSTLRNRFRFHLGLPTRVILTGAEAMSLGEAIFTTYPIPELGLIGIQRIARELALRGWLRHIQEVEFRHDPRPCTYSIAGMLGSPHLTNLRRLNLSNMGESGVMCDALGGQSRLYRLRSLNLSNSGVHVFALRSLCESPSLSSVEELDLSDNPLTDSAALALTRCRHFKRLKMLNLSRPDHLSKSMRKRLRRHFGDIMIL